nr:cytidine deaminase [uncultured Haemophilus sp.]
MQNVISQVLSENTPLNQAILHQLSSQNWAGFLSHTQVAQLCQQFELKPLQLAMQLLPVAACYSHTDISHFNVGAIAIGEQGDFYFGANQEFAGTAIQQTIHAEQSAISHAWLRNEKRISDIVVNYTPCGHCRQFMNELHQAEKLAIHLPHSQHNPLHKYLPDAFGPSDLNIQTHLLNQEDHHLNKEHSDPIIQQAIQAANQAHCPYSNSPNGVAILFKNGEIITGRYAENAAFNPSLPALQTALNYAYLNNLDLNNIERVVLAEKPNGLSYKGMSEQLLETLSETRLEYYLIA